LYRVLVILDQQSIRAYGKPMSLHAGLEVQADVFQERRKLYEWMLEPLYSRPFRTAQSQLEQVIGRSSLVVELPETISI
jgi:hypothetical protein